MSTLHKIIILTHRYVGIPISILCIIWFFSAFVIIYTGGMPGVSENMRIDAAEALDFERIRLDPVDAARQEGSNQTPILRTFLGRPAYFFAGRGLPTNVVFADNGETLDEISTQQARQIASEFLDIPAELFSDVEIVKAIDQWTVGKNLRMPLYKFYIQDEPGTQVYVSPSTFDLAVYTTTQSRVLAWLGAIPHWFYLTSLRSNPPLWFDVVVWTSAIGCILTILGLILAFTRFRKNVRPFSLQRAIPFVGMMRWHYILGAVFGISTLTWIFSGLLSMDPFEWGTVRNEINIDETVYNTRPMELGAFSSIRQLSRMAPAEGEIKEVSFSMIQEQAYYQITSSTVIAPLSNKRERLSQPYFADSQSSADSVLVHADSLQEKTGFDTATLIERLENFTPNADIYESALLNDYDDYYYSRNNQLPLPVLRVKFDDPLDSWVYINPQRSELLSLLDRTNRLNRWLYNGLHSLDFAFWYHKRPLWDLGLIILLAGGLVLSILGFYLGCRRLKQDLSSLFFKTG